MFQYRRTTNASRRAERKIKYLHVSAEVTHMPAGLTSTTMRPVLLTRAYFPAPKGPRGDTFNEGRNKAKRTKSQCRWDKAARRAMPPELKAL